MSIQHILYAIFVAAIWGSNFCAIKLGLQDMPPLLMLTIRFTLSTFPLIFLVKKPNLPWRYLVKLSLFLWTFHFIFMFLGVYLGVTAGLASLLMQVQIIFTVLISRIFFAYSPSSVQLIGILTSFAGLIMIACQVGGEGNLVAFGLLMLGALSVSISNFLYKDSKNENMLSILIWTSLVPIIPLFLLSLLIEGYDTIIFSLTHLTWTGGLSLLYSSWISTGIGMTLWGSLMRRYNPSIVSPYCLLVPVFGITFGVLFLNEPFTLENGIACTVVTFGLMINQLSLAFKSKRLKPINDQSTLKENTLQKAS